MTTAACVQPYLLVTFNVLSCRLLMSLPPQSSPYVSLAQRFVYRNKDVHSQPEMGLVRSSTGRPSFRPAACSRRSKARSLACMRSTFDFPDSRIPLQKNRAAPATPIQVECCRAPACGGTSCRSQAHRRKVSFGPSRAHTPPGPIFPLTPALRPPDKLAETKKAEEATRCAKKDGGVWAQSSWPRR